MTVPRKEAVGDRIRAAREALGLTQQQLAERLGVDRLTVLRIERGTRDVKTLELHRIAGVLGVSQKSLLSDEPVEERWQMAFRTSGLGDSDKDLIAWARKVFLNYRGMQERAKSLDLDGEYDA